MNDDKLELIVHNFINIMPLFKKSLLKHNCACSQDMFNHSHFQIMMVLKETGKQPISDVAKKVLISTPNMTKLLNKLIEEDMVQRLPHEKDRRIINIDLTSKGHKYIDEKLERVISSLKNKLLTLSDSQLNVLLDSLGNLNIILTEISSDN